MAALPCLCLSLPPATSSSTLSSSAGEERRGEGREGGKEPWAVLIRAAWRFTVLLAPSARRSWRSHVSLLLGPERAGGERRSAGWRGRRRKETHFLSQAWGAGSRAVGLACCCGAMVPRQSRPHSTSALGARVQVTFFAWCSTKVRRQVSCAWLWCGSLFTVIPMAQKV